MSNIKTVLTSYWFDTSKPEDAAAYKELSESLTARGSKCFETWGGSEHYLGEKFKAGIPVELETSSIFDNQWNTAPIEGVSDSGLRVFDWAQDYPINFRKGIKRGHYLDLTDEMTAIRRDTHKCGYCGHYEHVSAGVEFCPACIGSEYLKPSDLYLTRMRAVADDSKERKPLTDAERAMLLPKYKEAQLHGNTERDKKRIAAKRESIKADRDKAIKKAETEFAGLTWLMDHGIKTDNVIYYSHTDRWCFGWRDNGLAPELVDALLDVVSEFPFAYDIKCSDGRTLSGD